MVLIKIINRINKKYAQINYKFRARILVCKKTIKQCLIIEIIKLLFYFYKRINNNFIAYYLILTKASPKKLAPFNNTFIFTLIRLTARIIIKIKSLFDKISWSNYFRQVALRSLALILAIFVICSQSLAISGFEAHVVNVTAKISNDMSIIEPAGGEYCNILGATITLSTTYVGTSSIAYTTDGSEPDCENPDHLYTGQFTIYASATVQARTCHDGKQSAITSEYFTVEFELCPDSGCEAETIEFWAANEGCEDIPPASLWATQINTLSTNKFQSAFSTITAEEICEQFDLVSCPPAGTVSGELCRARGQALADLSNIVTGRLNLSAVIAGAFDNSDAFTNLNLSASSTIEQALNTVETVLINSSATVEDLEQAAYVAQRIYTFYAFESPYLPEPTCIYYDPGDVVLNEVLPNPSCESQPVDVVLIMDRSGSMGYDSPTRLSEAKSAANSFIDNLNGGDQSALVSYSTTASLDKILSGNHASTTNAVNALTASGATNIGDAINIANTELTSPLINPDASQVAILLTDGFANKPNGPGYGEWPADVAYAMSKADEAASSGIKIFTIGLGTGVNEPMLQYIASTTGAEYHFAPTPDDLEAIYELISEELCGEGDNDQYLTGLAGEWVELYNKGASAINLANWILGNAATTTYITINSANTYDGLTFIGPNGLGNEWQVILFNGARLNNFGDTVFLYDNINLLLDYYSYTNSIDDDPENDPEETPDEANKLDGNMAGLEGKSFARIPDGTVNWIDPVPTPGGPNKLEAEPGSLNSLNSTEDTESGTLNSLNDDENTENGSLKTLNSTESTEETFDENDANVSENSNIMINHNSADDPTTLESDTTSEPAENSEEQSEPQTQAQATEDNTEQEQSPEPQTEPEELVAQESQPETDQPLAESSAPQEEPEPSEPTTEEELQTEVADNIDQPENETANETEAFENPENTAESSGVDESPESETVSTSEEPQNETADKAEELQPEDDQPLAEMEESEPNPATENNESTETSDQETSPEEETEQAEATDEETADNTESNNDNTNNTNPDNNSGDNPAKEETEVIAEPSPTEDPPANDPPPPAPEPTPEPATEPNPAPETPEPNPTEVIP